MSEIITDYTFGIKREIVTALEPVFGDLYPDATLRNKVFVSTEFPYREVYYPAIFITYQEQEVRNIGLGHYELNDEDKVIKHWIFNGSVGFNILTKTTVDREMLSAGLINTLAFSSITPELRTFWAELNDADWVTISAATDNPIPGGESTQMSPWSDTETIYVRSYSVAIMGEFMTDAQTGGMVKISQIHVYPYRYDQPVPTGNSDPQNNSAPWVP